MAIPLKQSTASQEVLLGPFLDDTDGKTAETGLTIANTDIKIWKTGATTEANKNSGGATHIAGGRYYAVLDATDTDTLGALEINVHVSGALPVRRECLVLAANVYDSLIAASDKLDVNVAEISEDSTAANNLESYCDGTTPIPANTTQLSGDGTAADNAEAFFDGTGYAGTNNVIPTVTTLTNLPAITSGWLTATGIAASALDGKGNWNVGKTGYTLTATTGLGNQTANLTGNLSGSVGSVTGAVGSVTAAVTLPTIPANWITAAGIAADAIGASELAADAASEIGTAVWAATGRDLSTTPPTAAAVADAVWDEVLSGHSGVGSTGAALAAAGGSGDPWATALPGSYGAGTAGYVLGTNVNATISSRMATYTQPTGFLATTFPSGTVASTTNITAGTVTAGTVSDKTGYSLATAPPTAAAIADAVWDEVQSGHTTTGTFGKYLDAAVSGVSTGGVSAADIADAVWDEAASGHVGAGSFGARVDAAVSSRSSHSAADVWAATTRTLSAGTNIVLAKGTGVTGFTDLDAAGVRTAVGLASANLDTQLGAIDTVVDSILDDTGTAGVVVAAGSKTGYALAAAGLDSIVVETGVNARQALSPILAAAAGVVSGAATTSVVIKGGNVATTRIAATVDADGNRSAVTLTLPT
jgi:hypothetical protein